MKEDRSSGTALSVTTVRAVHQLIDDLPHILDDPVSLRLIGSDLAQRILRDPERHRSQPARALRSHLVLRSRYAEDALREAVLSGVGQFVSLGAGYDTFAYRQPAWAGGLKIIEVDHPATQSAKMELLKEKGVRIPENVEFLPLDLEKGELRPALAGTSLDPARPAFVSCLGVLAYLRVETVREIFGCVGSFPKTTRLALTFAMKTDEPQALAGRAAAHGEPWLARFDIEELRQELLGGGFSNVSFLDPSEAASLYYAGRLDLPPPGKVTMAQAVV